MKKIINYLIALFKVDHVVASTKALKVFDEARTGLQKVNESAAKKAADNLRKIAELEASNAVLHNVVSGNTNVLVNIGKILGTE